MFKSLSRLHDNFSQFLGTKATSPGSSQWQGIRRIFTPTLAQQIYEEFVAVLDIEIAQYPNDNFGIEQFWVRNRIRNRIGINPLKVWSNIAFPFTPGLNRELWNITPTIPPKLRKHYRIYRKIYQRHFPEMLAVPFVSGGKLVSLKPFSPLHTLLKTANKIQAGVAKSKVGQELLQELGIPLHHKFFAPSQLLGKAIAQVDPSHPDLNADTICRLQAENESNPAKFSRDRELLFYWQMWRWIMEGKD